MYNQPWQTTNLLYSVVLLHIKQIVYADLTYFLTCLFAYSLIFTMLDVDHVIFAGGGNGQRRQRRGARLFEAAVPFPDSGERRRGYRGRARDRRRQRRVSIQSSRVQDRRCILGRGR